MRISHSLKITKFTDPIIKVETSPSEFDISFQHNSRTVLDKKEFPDYNTFGLVVLSTYINKLLYIIAETPPLKREKFIDYQISIYDNPLNWLIEVDECMRANIHHFEENTIDRESYNDFQKIIARKAKEQEEYLIDGRISDPNQKIQVFCLNTYFNLVENSFHENNSIITFVQNLRWATHLLYKEILDNLVNLSNEEKKSYFETIKYELKTKNFQPEECEQNFKKWCSKYNADDFDIDDIDYQESGLYEILIYPKDDTFSDFDSDQDELLRDIRFDFFVYYDYQFYQKVLSFIEEQERNYFPDHKSMPKTSSISWEKSDTDLLELITALIESGSINNKTKNLSRKDAIKNFESFFNISIKDPENKLSKATSRKINQNPFLVSLNKAFLDYCDRKAGK